MEGSSLLILPSPALPATAYAGLAAALRSGGAEVTVATADLGGGETASDLLVRWSQLVGPDTVLVPHSNAGNLAPSVRAAGGGSQAIVFMDAALPPVTGSATLVPTAFREFLADLAGEAGVLPPWTQWWRREDLASVVPGADLAEIDRRCPRLPLSYFDFEITVPSGWVSASNAYLAFGDTYDEEFDLVVGRGWPHARIEGGHLHFLHDPDAVAARILTLVSQLVR
jgi:hypothetical protein